MKWFVYIIESQSNGILYKGFTQDIEKRIWEHNNGFSRYTKDKGPWKLVFSKSFETKKEALIFERRIKKFNSQSLENLIKRYSLEEGGSVG